MFPTTDRLFTVSNLISLVRLMLAIPVAWALLHDHYTLGLWLCTLAVTSDWLDGTIARLTNTESEWGKILDPLADKVLAGVVVMILMIKGLLPVGFVVAVVARDVTILIGGAIAARYTPVVPPSMWSGKLAVSAIAGAGLTALLQWTTARDWFMLIAALLMALSLWEYGIRLHGIIRQAQKNV